MFLAELTLLIMWTLHPLVTIACPSLLLYAIYVGIQLVLFFIESKEPNVAKNIKIMTMQKVNGEIGWSVPTNAVIFYIIAPAFIYALVDFKRISWAQLSVTSLLTAVFIMLVSDLCFGVIHKFFLHSPIMYKLHKLHHCCRYDNAMNIMHVHPVDLVVEFSTMFFMPLFLGSLLQKNDLMTLLMLFLVFFQAMGGHVACFSDRHHQHHHLGSEHQYGAFPLMFPDFMNIFFRAHGDAMRDVDETLKEK